MDYITVEYVRFVGLFFDFYPGYGPFPATTLHIPCPRNFWKFDKGDSPDAPVEPDGVRQRLEVRFWKLVTILQLTDSLLGITTNQSRHRFGLDNPALPHQKNSIRY
jgi:hypothetical protein